jgi:hypothetical protein
VKVLDALMAALFALAAVVQFNDPDPVRWAVLYGLSCLLSLGPLFGRRVPPLACAAVGGAALAWGLWWMAAGPGTGAYARMFDAWEMRSMAIEEAREASGLLLVAAWMAAVGARGARPARGRAA